MQYACYHRSRGALLPQAVRPYNKGCRSARHLPNLLRYAPKSSLKRNLSFNLPQTYGMKLFINTWLSIHIMKIFITGSSGFIGKELTKHITSKYEVVGFAHDEGCDILDYEQLKLAMKGCDVVVHLAAHRKPYEDKTFKNYFETNCQGTFLWLKPAWRMR